MMDKINLHRIPSQPLPINRSNKARVNEGTKHNFAQQLQTALGKTNKLTVSKHAQKRLKERAIDIDSEVWNEMEEKIGEAKKMGIIDSLVILENAALIVSAKNNTVITAMNRAEASSQIFTNINGTIVLE